MKKETVINSMLIISGTFYMIFLVWNILFKYVSPLELFSPDRFFSRSLNIMPFHDLFCGIYNQLDVWGNILLFIPLGIYQRLFCKHKWYSAIGVFAAVSLLFEVLQYIFAIGASDITDILYNTLGGMIGLGLYQVLKIILKQETSVKNVIAIVSFAAAAAVGIIIILLYLNN